MITRDILEAVFNARSVAVVGASNNPDKIGFQILNNIIGGGYGGQLYPVNPKSDEILGLKCHARLGSIPGDLDLVVVCVPAAAVPATLRDAAAKQVKGAVIISGGFREIGQTALEEEVMAIANEHNMAVIGPNCQGINYTPNCLCASWPLLVRQGSMAVIAQSGTIAAALGGWAEDDQLGFTALVALGNKSGVGEIELLDYFAHDEATRVIALNIEGVADGREFLDAAARAMLQKPLVVLKPGRTAKGAEAAASHTKSIAGSDRVFAAACRQYGIIRAEGVAEFYDYAKILGLLEKPSGRRLMVITSSGGSGILAVDTAYESGIELVDLSPETKAKLEAVLPGQCVVANPLDLTGDATAERYRDALDVVVRSDDADAFLVIFGDPVEAAAATVAAFQQITEKPILVAFLGGGQVEKREVPLLHAAGTPVFPTPERAVRALAALLNKR